MHKGLYIIGLLLLLLASCTGDKEVRALLDRAEVLLDSCPDSAYAIMQTVSSPNLRGSGDRVRSLYGLLRTTADAMQGKGVTADSLIRPAYEYYKEQGETDENIRRLGRSAFYLAQFEASRDSTKLAEDLYREAIRCSEQMKDWRTCYMAYSHFARIKAWSDTEEAIRLLNTAVEAYHKVEDKPANLISMLLDLSTYTLALHNFDQTRKYVNEAYNLANESNIDDFKYAAIRRLSSISYEVGNYPQALELIKQGMQGLTNQTRNAALFSLADCYLACDSLEQARNILLQIEQANVELNYEVNKALCKVAVRQNDIQHINSYFDSLETATVNMFTNIQQTKEEYYQDNLKKELYNMQLTQRKRQQAILLWGAIIMIVVIAVFVVIVINKNRRIAVQKRINTILLRRREQKAHVIAITELEQELNDKAKQIIDQQLLSDNQISMEKNEKEQLLQQYRNLQKQFTRFILRDTDLLQKLNSEKQVQPLTPDEWDQLAVVINQKSDNSIINLRNDFPELSKTDIQICMLTLLGLSNVQIADVLKRTSSTIKKRKHNIKTAIFGVQDTNIYFEFILRRLCS